MGCKVGAPLRLSLLLSVPVWCAFLPGTAQAACTNSPPANGQTVDCTGTNNTAVIAPAGVTGVNVTVESGASVTGQAASPAPNPATSSISVNDNSKITNNGSIGPSTVAAGNQVVVNLNGSNASLVNNGTIQINNNAVVPVAGTFYGVTTSPFAGGATNYSNVSVENHGNISVTQAGTGTASTVYSGEKIDSMMVDNYGTISMTRIGGTGTTRVGAVGSDDDTDDYKIINRAGATIQATGNNTYGILGRAGDMTIDNAGTIAANPGTTGARGAIVIYGGADDGPATANITNRQGGVINGNVIITDGNPFGAASTTPGLNVGAALTAAPAAGASNTRDSNITNRGAINGGFTYGAGTHVLTNTGTISGPIFVFQAAATAPAANIGGAPVGVGGASFSLTNRGAIGGDITIRDRSDSVNSISLYGTGFSGNITAVNGTGNNSLSLYGVTKLASVQNFRNLNLNGSNVTVPGGVSLVANAGLATAVTGPGGTRAAPSQNIGTINGTLTLGGATTLTPSYRGLARNGDVYQVASTVAGPGAGQITVQNKSALVKASADTSDGRLLLTTQVRNANTISGLNQPAQATLQALLSYNGNNAQVNRLGGLIESFGSLAQVRAAANALAPITNGADVQSPINAVMLFHQQIDSRLDGFLYSQLPSTGRSADLGTPRPVYGLLPTQAGWIEALGGGVHQSTVNQVNGYNAELEGVIGGYDRLITPGFRVGGAFGFINTQVNGNSNLGNRQTIQTFQGLGYAALEGARYYLRGSAGYGGVNFQSMRNISFANFNDIAYGSHGGNVFTARGEGGVPLEYRYALLVPYAAFTYSRLDQDGYAERSANGAGFFYRSALNNSERSEAGGKVIVPLVDAPLFARLFPSGSVVAVEARAAYVHEFGNVAQRVSASFAGTGDVFIASGPVPNRDMIDYGVGLRMATGRVQIDISYNGLARSTYLQQVGLLRARLLF